MTNTDDVEREALALFEAALDAPSDARRDWLRAQTGYGEAALARALVLLERDKEEQGAVLTGGAAEDFGVMSQPERIGRYRIDSLIGRGGMGAVWLGERDAGDFEHRAAIKLVQGLRAPPKLTERLRTERQTLARLHHPNIAQLYDGGETEEGEPYFVMEYVDGVSLRDYLTARATSLGERLDLFEQICDAVRYAHQQLIVHRDLAPQNIMVTAEAQAKLIDFGISQSLKSETDAGAPGYTMTKGYAAPERLRGEPSTTLSDIYSLGVILRELLDGLVPPRRGDIEAIIARAAAEKPEERYRSVDALVDDLSHYRQKRSVAAVEGGWRYRLARFVGRNRVAVGSGLVVGLGLIVATAVMSVLYVRADEAERKASQRFDDVRALAEFVLFDLYDDLDVVPGTTAVREKMAAESRRYLDRLSADEKAPFALRIDTALGYKRLGDVLGNPMVGNLGKREEAGELIKKAYTDIKAGLAEHTEDRDARRALAQTAYSYSVYQFIAMNDDAEALKLVQESSAAYQRLLNQDPENLADRLGLLAARQQEAKALSYLDRGEEAIALFKDIGARMRSLAKAHPDNADLTRNAAEINVDIANAMYQYYSYDDPEMAQAVSYADEGVESMRALAAAGRADARDIELNGLAVALWTRGRLLSYLQQSEQAVADLQEAEQIISKNLDREPNDKELRRRRLIAIKMRAGALADLGRSDDAEGAMREALSEIRTLQAEEPGNLGYVGENAEAYYFLADIQRLAGEWDAACESITISERLYADLKQEGGMSDYIEQEILPSVHEISQACAER